MARRAARGLAVVLLRSIGPLLLLLLLAQPVAAQLRVDAPPELRPSAERVERVDLDALGADLRRAGLTLPENVEITLIAGDDPRAARIPNWIVGLALGTREVVIFPDRVVSYPYDSLESVVRHEVAHLALTERASGQPLPRWFHEGVATSVDRGWSVGAQLRLLATMLEGRDTAGLTQLFASESETANRDAYLLAAVLVEDVRRRHGADVPGRIARAVAGGLAFDRAFQEQTGDTPDAAAARAWAAYRRWTEWLPAMTSASAMWALILVLAFVAYATRMRRRSLRRQQWEDENH